MTRIKSLRFNLKDGIDIPSHRIHRSKKNRKFKSESSIVYKKKLEKLKLVELIKELKRIII